MSSFKKVSLILRAGLALTLLYTAIVPFFHILDWLSLFPNFIQNTFSTTFLLFFAALYNIVLALWLVSGFRVFIPSILVILTLVISAFLNGSSLDIIVAAIPAVCAALSLSIMHSPHGASRSSRTAL